MAAETAPEHIRPKTIGFRTVVLEYMVDQNAKPAEISVVSSEADGLNYWAENLVKNGVVKEGTPGVVLIGVKKYKAEIAFPIQGDEAPLPDDITIPKVRIQGLPNISPKIWAREIAGGVLLRLSIDEKARVSKIELIRASHKDFGQPAIDAVKKWQFSQPAKKSGQAIPISLFQLIIFETAGKKGMPWQWQVSPEPALPAYIVTTNTN